VSTFLAAQVSVAVRAQAPDPSPVAPPGSSSFLDLLNWALWIVMGLGVLGFLICAGALMVQHSHGTMAKHGGNIALVAIGCIVAASASGMVNLLMA